MSDSGDDDSSDDDWRGFEYIDNECRYPVPKKKKAQWTALEFAKHANSLAASTPVPGRGIHTGRAGSAGSKGGGGKKESTGVLREIFDSLDVDGSGGLDSDEVRTMAARMGMELSEKEFKRALQALDPDEDGNVTFEEFVKWWETAPAAAEDMGMVAKLRERNSSSIQYPDLPAVWHCFDWHLRYAPRHGIRRRNLIAQVSFPWQV